MRQPAGRALVGAERQNSPPKPGAAAPAHRKKEHTLATGRRSVWIGGPSHCLLNKIARVILCGPENIIGISSGDRRGGVL